VTNGTLYLLSVPIGNLQDISLRALEVLRRVSLLIVEDTRVTKQLLNHYGIDCTLHRYDTRRLEQSLTLLRQTLQEGKEVALVSDAGTPTIADPGNRAVQEALRIGAKVTAIPGASAVLTALVLSGMAQGRFAFDGFPPTSTTDRHAFFTQLSTETRTIILYKTASRLRSTLCALAQYLGGERDLLIAKDLTKPTENLLYTTLSAACATTPLRPRKGEYTLVIAVGTS
jgi:16S rRNA (cytidine1402-2'-O)-methyltransferase